MRALAISDLHFGAWTGDPVLAREFALRRLEPHLETIDELILLGDVFDFLFSTVEHAFAQADPFFELVRRKLQGKSVVFLAGNHDHHIVVRTLRSLVEARIATGAAGEELGRVFEAEYAGFFQRFMDRRLDGVDCRIVYPTHRVGDVLLTHGHYLDAHMEGSFPNRLQARATLTIGGVNGNGHLSEEDYEAAIVPLTELLFTVAQMPRGCTVQMSFHQQFGRIGKLLRLGSMAGARLRRLGGRAGDVASARIDRACSPEAPVPLALSAFGQVARNLGWDRQADKIVFAHTHQPLAAQATGSCEGTRFWNTGSWIFEPPVYSYDAYVGYLSRAWPGTLVLIDSDRDEPELIETLADQNPLHGGAPRPGEMLRSEIDMFRARGEQFARRARAVAGPEAATRG
jgi:predicted phosphodiesterase